MNQVINILVTGADGQLGMALRDLSVQYPGINWHFHNRETLSITDKDKLEAFISTQAITHCINCAAYTAVDLAETEKEKAYSINADAAGFLAEVCALFHVTLVHISTDYVFNGMGSMPYKETDPVGPGNVYGASKLAGEQQVLQYCPNAIIIRTSWVYSRYGKNFVKTMIRLMQEKETISVVNDQQGSPTSATDLAGAILSIITGASKPVPGIYNYCNEGIITWYEFAQAIRECISSTCNIVPVSTAAFPTAAIRPVYSALDCHKIRQTFGIKIPHWKESLHTCLSEMGYPTSGN